MMRDISQLLVSGLATGAVYAIIALGFNVVYKATRVLNFAHGEYLVICGILASVLTRQLGWPFAATALVVIVVGVGLGLGTELIVFTFLRKPDPLTMAIGAIAVAVILQAVVLTVTGGKNYGLDSWPGASFNIGSQRVEAQLMWNVGLAVLLTFALRVFFTSTRTGIALQAAADDRATASLYGVSPRSTAMWSFALAGALGAVGGMAVAPLSLMAFHMGLLLGLKGFTAAVLGGLGSMPGALIGGLTIGILEAAVSTYVSGTAAPFAAFVVLLVVLFVRPTGIFKSQEVQRV